MPTDLSTLPRDVAHVAKDLLYVTVGFGVLAVQRAQATRRELAGRLADPIGTGRDGVEKASTLVEQQRKTLEARMTALEERVDAALDQVEARLPEQARTALHQARDAAKSAREQVRDLVHRAA